MPDITLCFGVNCPIKEQCYRFTARPEVYQSYFYDSPREGLTCNYFIQNTTNLVINDIDTDFSIDKPGVYFDSELNEIYLVEGEESSTTPFRRISTKNHTYVGHLIKRESLSYIGEF